MVVYIVHFIFLGFPRVTFKSYLAQKNQIEDPFLHLSRLFSITFAYFGSYCFILLFNGGRKDKKLNNKNK